MQQHLPLLFSETDFLSFLVDQSLLAEAEAIRAEHASSETGAAIESTLLELGLVNEENLYGALARHLEIPFLEADQLEACVLEESGLPLDFLQRSEILPAAKNGRGLVLATANPRSRDAISSIEFHLSTPVYPAIATPSTIKTALLSLAPVHEGEAGETSSVDIERLAALASDGPVIKLVNDLISQAAKVGASDIHIESNESDARVRFRLDGVLQVHRNLPKSMQTAVASRLKVMARLNISEKRRPQDGRAQVSVRGNNIDIRVSTLPTQFGESIVLRLLDRTRLTLDWQSLGYDEARARQIEQAVSQPNGVFLVAGPTGSGKTTTLYTALDFLNSVGRKIVTVEDPIEYSLPGINQVQVEPEIGMSFANALRSILRQDPDIIMVGEIRDAETAEIAIRAALVGRMVLSTIHTNDALSAVVRLKDLGVPPYLLAATMRGVLSQRLVRTICQQCRGSGCDACGSSGQRGRSVVSEFLDFSTPLVTAVSEDAGLQGLSQAAQENGFVPLVKCGHELVQSKVCSEQEILRAVGRQ